MRKNPHYIWKNIEARHFIHTGGDCGLSRATCMAIIEEMIAMAPSVIENVSNEIPRGFPDQVPDTIFAGLKDSAMRLYKMRHE